MNSIRIELKSNNKTSDLFAPMPPQFTKEHDLRRNDLFIVDEQETHSKQLVFKRAIRLSRFRREMNKYMRRMVKTKNTFIVLRNNQEVFVLLPILLSGHE